MVIWCAACRTARIALDWSSRPARTAALIELVAAAICLILLASAIIGTWVQTKLPTHHHSRDSIDSVRLVVTILVTFAALVLGLLTSSAEQRHDDQIASLERFGVDLIELDQRLREYGPEAAPIRVALRAYTAAAIADTWPDEPRPGGTYPLPPALGPANGAESYRLGDMLGRIDRMIDALTPTDTYHGQAAYLLRLRAADVLAQRWRLISSTHTRIAWPFMAVLLFWLVIIFAIFGLSSPRNALVHVVVVLSALSIASSLYLIMDFESPLAGLLRVPSEPLRDALAHMDRPAQQPP